MLPSSKCPVCGGEVVAKDVEKLLRGGVHVAVITVRAEVCLRCGERLYSQETISRFEQIRAKLARQDVASFDHWGNRSKLFPQWQVNQRCPRLSWLVGALFAFLARIGVSWLGKRPARDTSPRGAPPEARAYVARVEELTGVPITFTGVGPEREEFAL